MREHLLVEPDGTGWRLSGLFDFEPAMRGAREYEFASIGLFVSGGDARALRCILRAYGYAEAQLDDALQYRLMAMALLHRYSNLPWYLQRLPLPGAIAPGTTGRALVETAHRRTRIHEETDMSYALTGFDGKVAVVTGAGRMRSIGRPIALALARAGCDLVLTGSGKPASAYPEDEQRAGWRDIESVADEVRALGRRALPLVSDVRDPQAVEALAAARDGRMGPRRLRHQQRRLHARQRPRARHRAAAGRMAARAGHQPGRHLLHVALLCAAHGGGRGAAA